jgi:hypothetical protein
VHRDEPSELGRRARAYEHADLLRGRVDVRGERLALLGVEAGGTGHGDVLTDLRDELDALVLEGAVSDAATLAALQLVRINGIAL